MTGFDRSWRTLPEKNIRYLDASIYLTTYRDAPKKGVQPMTLCRYAGEETEWPLAASNPYFSTQNFRIHLENLGDKAVYFNTDDARLWFYDSAGDWLPLEMNRHPANGLLDLPLVRVLQAKNPVSIFPFQKIKILSSFLKDGGCAIVAWLMILILR